MQEVNWADITVRPVSRRPSAILGYLHREVPAMKTRLLDLTEEDRLLPG